MRGLWPHTARDSLNHIHYLHKFTFKDNFRTIQKFVISVGLGNYN